MLLVPGARDLQAREASAEDFPVADRNDFILNEFREQQSAAQAWRSGFMGFYGLIALGGATSAARARLPGRSAAEVWLFNESGASDEYRDYLIAETAEVAYRRFAQALLMNSLQNWLLPKRPAEAYREYRSHIKKDGASGGLDNLRFESVVLYPDGVGVIFSFWQATRGGPG